MDSAECQILIVNLHNKTNFGKKLYCNGIIPLTPEKNGSQSPKVSPSSSGAGVTPPTQGSPAPLLSPPSPLPPPSPLIDIGPQSIIPETPDTHMQLGNIDLVRRHSVSLRSPPPGSLADYILKTGSGASNLQIQKVRSMMSEVKEALSDFDSCMSSPPSESSSSESETENSGTDKFKTVQRGKGWKNNKRKKNFTPPSKDHFLKKPNTANSPQ